MPPKDESEATEDILYTRLLVVPERTQSSVPADLMENLTKRERDTLEKLSIMAQRLDWLTDAVMLNNDALRSMERRFLKVERWRGALTSKWSVVVAIALILAPYLIPKLASYVFFGKSGP